jgi:hypothetical protein
VSYDTVARWARRGKWQERVEQLRAIGGVGCQKDLAATLKVEAQALTADMLKGVQYRLAARMPSASNVSANSSGKAGCSSTRIGRV